MTSTIPFTYGEFCDFPRMIEFQFKGVWYFLRSHFDEAKDDYNDYYDVYRLPYSEQEILANPLYFTDLSKAEHLGQIPVKKIGLTSGTYTVGATVTVGSVYALSGATAGGIAPIADLTSGWFTQIVLVGLTATTAKLTLVSASVAVP